MAITSTGLNAAYATDTTATKTVDDKSKLNSDDFMTLLLAELQYQDPTSPTDTESILTQTSQLASLESSDKTTQLLEDLTKSLSSSNNFSSISAIGKMGDLGSNAVVLNEGSDVNFEMYYPSDVKSGTVEILDVNGNVLKNIDAQEGSAGVYSYTWDGTDNAGNALDSGTYYITSSYTDGDGNDATTRLGTYPIESVRFEDGKALVKVGSSYVPLESLKEIY